MICEELVCLYIYLYNFYVFGKILSGQIFQEGKILKQVKSIEILSGSFWYLDYWWIWYRIISNYMKLFCMESTTITCSELGTKTCNKFSGHSPVVKVWIHLWLCILVERLAKITKGLEDSSNQRVSRNLSFRGNISIVIFHCKKQVCRVIREPGHCRASLCELGRNPSTRNMTRTKHRPPALTSAVWIE